VTWAPDYLTTSEAKDYLGVTDALDDAQLALWVTAASRAIDTKTNRQFGQLTVAAARTYRRAPYYVADLGLWVLDVDDIYSAVGLTIATGGGSPVAYASSGAVLLPDNAPADSRPWTQLGWTSCPTGPVIPTALWGWAAIPTQVKAAGQLQVSRWNFRRQSPAGVAGSPDSGSEVRLTARLDPDVATTLLGLSRRRRVG
jgi:hypothetical protein